MPPLPSWVQPAIYVLIVLGPVLIKIATSIGKRIQAHAAKRRLEIERERAQIEALRTGRPVVTSTGTISAVDDLGLADQGQPRAEPVKPLPTPFPQSRTQPQNRPQAQNRPQPQSAREALEELAARRQRRTEELARRRTQNSGRGSRPPAPTARVPDRPPPVSARPVPTRPMPPRPPERRTPSRETREERRIPQPLESTNRLSQPMTPSRAPIPWKGVAGSEDSDPTWSKLKPSAESEAAYAQMERVSGQDNRASRIGPTSRRELRRAIILNEILTTPVALREQPTP